MDARGVVQGSFRTWNLRNHKTQEAKAAAIRRLLTRSITGYGASCVVIGRSRRVRRDPTALCTAAKAAADAAGVPVAERSIEDARRVLFGGPRGPMGGGKEAVGRLLVAGLFPELGGELERSRHPAVKDATKCSPREFRRQTWNALAVALVEYVRLFPADGRGLLARWPGAPGGLTGLLDGRHTQPPPENLPVVPPI